MVIQVLRATQLSGDSPDPAKGQRPPQSLIALPWDLPAVILPRRLSQKEFYPSSVFLFPIYSDSKQRRSPRGSARHRISPPGAPPPNGWEVKSVGATVSFAPQTAQRHVPISFRIFSGCVWIHLSKSNQRQFNGRGVCFVERWCESRWGQSFLTCTELRRSSHLRCMSTRRVLSDKMTECSTRVVGRSPKEDGSDEPFALHGNSTRGAGRALSTGRPPPLLFCKP